MRPHVIALLCFASALLLVSVGAEVYGFFRDELYFIACGRRLAWGYVDQPPLTPFIAAMSAELAGGSVRLFRLPAYLAGASLVALTAWFASALGGRTFAMVLAAIAVFVAPQFLASSNLLTMNVFEPLFWTAVALVALRVDEQPRRWVGIGVLIGVGLLNKYSMAFYAGALLVSFVATSRRRALATRWFIAVLFVAPNIAWQAANGWPLLELLGAAEAKNAEFTLAGFLGGQLLLLHPVGLLVWGTGLVGWPTRSW